MAKIDFTPTGGVLANLGDDANKYGIVIERIGGISLEQAEPLAGAAVQALFARGNVLGDLVFRSAKSYTDYATTFTQFKTEYGRLNQVGSLVLTEGASTSTFANAICKGVERIFDDKHGGTRMGIRYTFQITTIT